MSKERNISFYLVSDVPLKFNIEIFRGNQAGPLLFYLEQVFLFLGPSDKYEGEIAPRAGWAELAGPFLQAAGSFGNSSSSNGKPRFLNSEQKDASSAAEFWIMQKLVSQPKVHVLYEWPLSYRRLKYSTLIE